MSYRRSQYLVYALLAGAAAHAWPSAAQTPADSRRPSAAQIVQSLAPAKGAAKRRDRGVSLEGQAQEESKPLSIDLEVNFEFGSAKLTGDAKLVLDNLGQALKDPALQKSRIRIGGHTDGVGSDAANLLLSRQRARAAADYLSAQHGVAPARLSVEGFGRTRLKDAANPSAAINRRVEVVNLGAGA